MSRGCAAHGLCMELSPQVEAEVTCLRVLVSRSCEAHGLWVELDPQLGRGLVGSLYSTVERQDLALLPTFVSRIRASNLNPPVSASWEWDKWKSPCTTYKRFSCCFVFCLVVCETNAYSGRLPSMLCDANIVEIALWTPAAL